MSARDNALDMMTQEGDSDDLIDSYKEILRAYRYEVLQEAAEKIRNSEYLRDMTDDHMSDCFAAADLIDP